MTGDNGVHDREKNSKSEVGNSMKMAVSIFAEVSSNFTAESTSSRQSSSNTKSTQNL